MSSLILWIEFNSFLVALDSLFKPIILKQTVCKVVKDLRVLRRKLFCFLVVFYGLIYLSLLFETISNSFISLTELRLYFYCFLEINQSFLRLIETIICYSKIECNLQIFRIQFQSKKIVFYCLM